MELNKLHQGLTYDQYAAQPGLRSSDLKLLKRSAEHWKSHKDLKEEDEEEGSDALQFGHLFHLAIESPEKFLETYQVAPVFEGPTKEGKMSTQSAAAKQMKKEWYAALKPDSIVVRAEWRDELIGMLQSVRKHRLLRNLLRDGVRETSLWIEDPHTGVTLQCRPDFITEKGHMVDIKTTRDARPRFFRNQIFRDGNENDPFYVLQAAHYAHCARHSNVCLGDRFFFVAIEKKPPYGIMTYALGEPALAPGEQWRHELTKIYANCMKTETWPGYPEEAVETFPPEWVSLPVEEE